MNFTREYLTTVHLPVQETIVLQAQQIIVLPVQETIVLPVQETEEGLQLSGLEVERVGYFYSIHVDQYRTNRSSGNEL